MKSVAIVDIGDETRIHSARGPRGSLWALRLFYVEGNCSAPWILNNNSVQQTNGANYFSRETTTLTEASTSR